jgi:PAS domain S-box-containing protein
MKRKSILANVLLGQDYIKSRKEYKYAMLRGEFGLIVIGVSIFYVVLDIFNGLNLFLPWYGVLACIGFTSLILNRYKYYHLATVLLLVLTNFLVYFFADTDHPHGGVYFFFMPCSMAALILLSYYNRHLGIAFALLPLISGCLAFSTDLNILPAPVLEYDLIRINFIVNFLLAMLSSIFIVYFLITRNLESEKSLLESERHLIKLSADLKISEERFAMALAGTRAGIYEWKLKDNSIYVSGYWKNLLGYEGTELSDLTIERFLSFIHPEDLARTSLSIENHLQNHLPYQNELRIRSKQGEYKWFLDSGVSKLDADAKASVVIGSIIDIDERKKAEKELAVKNSQLAKTNEELDRFVYSASHDMRAPLTSMLGLINLSERANPSDEMKSYLAWMTRCVATMEGFIKEVTDYSRNARLDFILTEFHLHDFISDTTKNLAYTVIDKKVRIEINVLKELVIKTDSGRLKIVLSNLISNAYKYHRYDQPDPYIRIDGEQKGDDLIVRIVDNGSGIPEKHLPRIFDMFYRASENSQGSGLGLYIVKEALQKLGGAISVESEFKAGTTFTISIPLRNTAVS